MTTTADRLDHHRELLDEIKSAIVPYWQVLMLASHANYRLRESGADEYDLPKIMRQLDFAESEIRRELRNILRRKP